MQQITLPQAITDIAKNRDSRGMLVADGQQCISYITGVLQHLQDTKQNLSTVDFVDFITKSLGVDYADIVYYSLPSAFFNALVLPYCSGRFDTSIKNSIVDWLGEQRLRPTMANRYLCLLHADYPMPSTLNPKKLAVWRNTSKIGDWDKRQAVSVRKWIGSTFKELTAEQAESLAKRIDGLRTTLDNLDVRHHTSYEFSAWEQAYTSDKIRSCMHPASGCHVGTERTFTCYCSGYHGLPDNGLTLTVLYQNDEPVARAITFTNDDGQKCFVRAYGDDRLAEWLDYNDYEASSFQPGTILYTTETMLKPYIDGEVTMAEHCSPSEGKYYWALYRHGTYELQTTSAYIEDLVECECCAREFDEDETSERYSSVNGHYYTVCTECEPRNSYYVYTGDADAELVFFHDGHSPDTNTDYVEYNNEYYEVDSLGEYDLRLIDGEVYHENDLHYCEKTGEWFVDSYDVYIFDVEISITQPVFFPYDCISKEYWDANVVETTCGTLALVDDTRELSMPSLGSVVALDEYWTIYTRLDARGERITGIVFKLEDIERAYEYDPTAKLKAFLDYAIEFNKIQYLRLQELGI